MRITLHAAFVLAIAAGLLVNAPAWAQQDTRDLVDRLDRLERDLNILQSQFYRSQQGGAPNVITSPAAGGGGASPGETAPISGDVYSTLDQRIGALEDQVRNLTDQVQRADHNTAELSAKIDRMNTDNDVRFKALEQRAGAGPNVAANTPAEPAGPGNAPAEGSAGTWNPTMGSPPHPLGQIPESALKKSESRNADVAANAPPPPAGRTPQEQYDYAFGLLRASDYDGATRAFQSFVSQHPNDPLAGNATFWLGQIAYSQGKYEQAAPIFFDAYRKYPKSAKAGESLLKVGLSMSNLGKKKEACAALARFNSEFPDASESLKRQAAAENKKLACG